MNTGKILGEPSAVYHATDACSHSKLEKFRRRPRLYRDYYITKEAEPPTTDALEFGIAFHSALLDETPCYSEAPFDDFRTKAAREWRDAEQAQGRVVLSKKDYELLSLMLANFPSNLRDRLFHAEAEREVTWRTTPPSLSFPCQCRADLWLPNGSGKSKGKPVMVDLKTTRELIDEPTFWSKIAAERGYHRQEGFYRAMLSAFGVEDLDFFFVVVEKQYPYETATYQLPEAMKMAGWDETMRDLQRLEESIQTGDWREISKRGIIEAETTRWWRPEEETA